MNTTKISQLDVNQSINTIQRYVIDDKFPHVVLVNVKNSLSDTFNSYIMDFRDGTKINVPNLFVEINAKCDIDKLEDCGSKYDRKCCFMCPLSTGFLICINDALSNIFEIIKYTIKYNSNQNIVACIKQGTISINNSSQCNSYYIKTFVDANNILLIQLGPSLKSTNSSNSFENLIICENRNYVGVHSTHNAPRGCSKFTYFGNVDSNHDNFKTWINSNEIYSIDIENMKILRKYDGHIINEIYCGSGPISINDGNNVYATTGYYALSNYEQHAICTLSDINNGIVSFVVPTNFGKYINKKNCIEYSIDINQNILTYIISESCDTSVENLTTYLIVKSNK